MTAIHLIRRNGILQSRLFLGGLKKEYCIRATLPRSHLFMHRAATMATISSAITKDHRELEAYYNEVINNPNDHDHQQRYGNMFVWELARHSVGEELVVYPALENYLGAKGVEMAKSDRDEHHTVRDASYLLFTDIHDSCIHEFKKKMRYKNADAI